jgi:ABC-type multidrug transport system ATPase subunit
VIVLENVSARRKPATLTDVSLTWEPGIHAVIGTPADGCSLLLALVVGAARVQSGRLRVLDGSPTDAIVRPQVARVGVEPSIPEALRVDEVLALAAAVRGEPARTATERLSVLGLEALAQRPVRSLSRGEARGVALAEAVTSSRVRVLVVEEPLSATDPRAASRISQVLRDKSRSGCVIVFSTASLRDAGEIADDYVLIRRGVLAGRTTSLHALAGFAPGGARLVVVARDVAGARAMVAALAEDKDGDVAAVEQEASTVRVRGPDPIALARAAARAAVNADVDVLEMRIEPPPLDGTSPASPERGRNLDGTSPASPERGRNLDEVRVAAGTAGAS